MGRKVEKIEHIVKIRTENSRLLESDLLLAKQLLLAKNYIHTGPFAPLDQR